MPKVQTTDVKIAVMGEKITNIESDIAEIKKALEELVRKIDDTYVTKNEFDPVRTLVYGMVGLILTSVIGAIVYGVIEVTH